MGENENKYGKFLPIGTVIMLKNGKKRLMITGFCPTVTATEVATPVTVADSVAVVDTAATEVIVSESVEVINAGVTVADTAAVPVSVADSVISIPIG